MKVNKFLLVIGILIEIAGIIFYDKSKLIWVIGIVFLVSSIIRQKQSQKYDVSGEEAVQEEKVEENENWKKCTVCEKGINPDIKEGKEKKIKKGGYYMHVKCYREQVRQAKQAYSNGGNF